MLGKLMDGSNSSIPFHSHRVRLFSFDGPCFYWSAEVRVRSSAFRCLLPCQPLLVDSNAGNLVLGVSLELFWTSQSKKSPFWGFLVYISKAFKVRTSTQEDHDDDGVSSNDDDDDDTMTTTKMRRRRRTMTLFPRTSHHFQWSRSICHLKTGGIPKITPTNRQMRCHGNEVRKDAGGGGLWLENESGKQTIRRCTPDGVKVESIQNRISFYSFLTSDKKLELETQPSQPAEKR